MNDQNQYNQDGGRYRRNESFSHAEKPPTKNTRQKVAFLWVIRIATVLYISLGVFVFYLSVISPALKNQKSANWIETPCKILESRVERDRSGSTELYFVLIRYSYEWQGEIIIGTRYNFDESRTSNDAGKERIVRSNPKGKKTFCYVNPDNPTESVIVREAFDGRFPSLLSLLIPLAFIVSGSAFLVYTFVKEKLFLPKIADNHVEEKSYPGFGDHTPRKLTVKEPPHGAFFMSLVFVGVFAAVISTLAVTTQERQKFWNFQQWQNVIDISIGTTMFVVTLGGLGVLVYAIREGLSLLGSKINVIMKPCLRASETAKLRWETSQYRWRNVSLKIELHCLETTSEGAEENSEPVEEDVLHEIHLLNRRLLHDENTGELSITIPANAPVSCCTRKGNTSTEISWEIHATIHPEGLPAQRWKFEFFVEPPPQLSTSSFLPT